MSFKNPGDKYLRERGITRPPANMSVLSVNAMKRETGIASSAVKIDYLDLDGHPIDHCRYVGLDPAATTDHRKATNKRGSKPKFYLTRRAARAIRKRRESLLFGESEIKAEAAAQHGIPCIGLGGVFGWSYDKQPIADFNLIDWKDRRVELCFDSDWATNPDVRRAQVMLADHLSSLGAIVTIRLLYDVTGTGKSGLDDFLKARGKEGYEAAPLYPLDHPHIASWRTDAGLVAELEPQELPADWLAKEPPPIEFLWQHMLPRATVGLLIGEGAVGKTYFTLQFAMSLAGGLRYLGLDTRRSKVLYIALEDPTTELQRRLYHIGKALVAKKDRKPCAENLHYMSLVGQQLHLIDVRNGSAVQTKELARLTELVKRDGYEFVVLDPMSRLHGADENANATGTALINAAEHIARATGCAVLVAHHTGKANAKSRNEGQYSARGASGIADAARVVLRLRQCDADELRGMVLPEGTNPKGVARLIHAKSNYSPRYEDVWLRRTDHGVLERIYPEFKAGAVAYTAWIARLRAWADSAGTFTKRSVARDLRADIFGKQCSRATAEAHFELAITDGDVEQVGKRTGGDEYRCTEVAQ